MFRKVAVLVPVCYMPDKYVDEGQFLPMQWLGRKMATVLTTSVRILLVGIAYSELAVHYACTYNVSDVHGQCNQFPNAMGLDLGIVFLLDNA